MAEESATNVGTNVEGKVERNILTLTVNLKERGQVSKSGKSVVVGTTHGFVQVGNVGVSLNVTRPLRGE